MKPIWALQKNLSLVPKFPALDQQYIVTMLDMLAVNNRLKQSNQRMDDSTLEKLAELICGDDTEVAPVYRSGGQLTQFFGRAGLPHLRHDGTTRKWWTLDALRQCNSAEKAAVIKRLAAPKEYGGDPGQVRKALRP